MTAACGAPQGKEAHPTLGCRNWLGCGVGQWTLLPSVPHGFCAGGQEDAGRGEEGKAQEARRADGGRDIANDNVSHPSSSASRRKRKKRRKRKVPKASSRSSRTWRHYYLRAPCLCMSCSVSGCCLWCARCLVRQRVNWNDCGEGVTSDRHPEDLCLQGLQMPADFVPTFLPFKCRQLECHRGGQCRRVSGSVRSFLLPRRWNRI